MATRDGSGVAPVDAPATTAPLQSPTPGAADAHGTDLAALSLHPHGPGGFGAVAPKRAARSASPPRCGGRETASGDALGDAAVAAVSLPVVGGGGAVGSGRLGVPGALAALAPAPSCRGAAGGAALAGAADVVDPVDPSSVATSEPADAAPPAEAWSNPFCPPATERHAAFLRLVDTRSKAAWKTRYSRSADFAGQAAEAGAALFGGDSLIVAGLRVDQAVQLSNQAEEEKKRGPSGAAEAARLDRRSWVLLVALALSVIHSRISSGTLLPGRCRPVEEAFVEYEQQALSRVTGTPPPEPATLRRFASAAGYETALVAACLALNLLPCQLGNADQRERTRAFVLAALRRIPQTVNFGHAIDYENALVDMIEPDMSPSNYGDDFCAAVLALWRSPAVADVLRSRGALQGGVAAKAAADAEFDARQKADLAKYGLQACALPSCGRREATALQFRVCGACKATRYCGPEHQAAHAEAHRPQCRGRG